MNRHQPKGLIEFFSISSKKCLKHFIMKPFRLSAKVDIKLAMKLQLRIDSTHPMALSSLREVQVVDPVQVGYWQGLLLGLLVTTGH